MWPSTIQRRAVLRAARALAAMVFVLPVAASALDDPLRIYQILPEEAPDLHDGSLGD